MASTAREGNTGRDNMRMEEQAWPFQPRPFSLHQRLSGIMSAIPVPGPLPTCLSNVTNMVLLRDLGTEPAACGRRGEASVTVRHLAHRPGVVILWGGVILQPRVSGRCRCSYFCRGLFSSAYSLGFHPVVSSANRPTFLPGGGALTTRASAGSATARASAHYCLYCERLSDSYLV